MNGVVLLKAQLFQIKSDERTKFRILVTGAFLFAYHGNEIASDDDDKHDNKEASRIRVTKVELILYTIMQNQNRGSLYGIYIKRFFWSKSSNLA